MDMFVDKDGQRSIDSKGGQVRVANVVSGKGRVKKAVSRPRFEPDISLYKKHMLVRCQSGKLNSSATGPISNFRPFLAFTQI